MKRQVVVVASLALASCGSGASVPQHEAARPPEMVLVSRAVRAGIPSEVSVGAETIELRIHGEMATISQSFERLGQHGWTIELVVKTEGTARPSSEGWVLDFRWHEPHGDRFVSRSARLSCVRTTKRVHVVGAQPVGLCTAQSRWTPGEQDVPGWWCEEVLSRRPGDELPRSRGGGVVDPVERSHSRFVLPSGEFFTPPPGVEHVSQTCCPPDSNACDTSDGGERRIK